MSEHDKGEDVVHIALVEERERDDIQAMAYRLRCAVCETEYEGDGGDRAVPALFVCDVCGAVNTVQL